MGIFEKLMGLLLGLFLVVSIISFGFFISHLYTESKKPTFDLQKEDWACTKGHDDVRLVMVGKVLIPHNVYVCTQWSAK